MLERWLLSKDEKRAVRARADEKNACAFE